MFSLIDRSPKPRRRTLYGWTLAGENMGVSALADPNFPVAVVSNVVNGPNGTFSYQLGNGLNQAYRYDGLGRRDGSWLCAGSTSQFCTGGSQTSR